MMLDKLQHINCLVFDVDGVLTDGTLLVMPGGLMARRMNIKDGYALQLAVKKGYRVIVISGGDSPEVQERLHKLGITDVNMRVADKLSKLKELVLSAGVRMEQVAFMGDDVPDKACMQAVGLAVAPADAAADILKIAHYITPEKGGEGAARHFIEKLMRVKGDWHDDFSVQAK